MNIFQTKNCNLELKDIDTATRKVSGYFASFGTIDSDKDMFAPGAFKKSISENGPKSNKSRVKHLAFHNPNMNVGKILELGEDSKGLYFTSQISKAQFAQDILTQYEEGILSEHSVGFIMVNAGNKGEYNEITETKLFEGSTVTWGANENTPLTEIKGMDNPQLVLERYDKISKLLRKGSLTDETCQLLELEVLNLQKHYNDLQTALKNKQPVAATVPDFEPQKIETILDNSLNRFQKWI